MVHSDPYIKRSSSEAEDNYSQDSGVDEASNGDCEDNEEQEDEQFDPDSSGRTESSESEDISKQWDRLQRKTYP